MSKDIEEIAIVGMSGAFPGAKSIQDLWEMVIQKRNGISTFSREQLLAAGESIENIENPSYVPCGGFLDDAFLFDNNFFNMLPGEALITDPQHRLFLTHSWLALDDAGCDPAKTGQVVGVFAGEGIPEYWFLQQRKPIEKGLKDFRLMLGNDKDYLATKVSYKLNLKGPSVDIQSACSSSLVAVGIACQSLLAYGCDIALAGGVAITANHGRGFFYYDGMIYSKTGRCRPFDRDSDGTIFGEGVGVVCLKRLSEAQRDNDYIYAVLKSVALNNDGSDKIGFAAPSVAGQSEAIELAQGLADVAPEEIGYVETHGTATALGDTIEIEALRQAFRRKTEKKAFCYLGSLKANIGHLDAAAGIASLIKTVLIVNTGKIPPLYDFENPNPRLDLDSSPFLINTETVDWPLKGGRRIAGVSSFGVGGTNAHAILESPPSRKGSDAEPGDSPLLLSAKSAASLEARKKELASFLSTGPSPSLGDVVAKAMRVSHDFPYRWGAPVRDREALIEALSVPVPVVNPAGSPRCVFAFPGQGAQFPGMAKAYYRSLPVFSRWIDRGIAFAESLGLGDVGRCLLDDASEAELSQTRIAQPLLFIVEYALAMELVDRGVVPVAVAGHSIGEFAAAALAGVFGFEEGLRLVERRGYWMQQAPRGAMTAVAVSAEGIGPYLAEGVSIALYNSGRQVVLSGGMDEVAAVEERLAVDGISYARIKTSHAFHSPLMEGILEPFKREMDGIAFTAPKIPFLSNLDGGWAADTLDWKEYWASQLRRPVRFDLCIQAIGNLPDAQVLEVGPGKVLSGLFRSSGLALGSIPLLPSAGASDRDFESSLIRCWANGLPVLWPKRKKAPDALVLSPGYSFEKHSFWVGRDPSDDRDHADPAVPARRADDSGADSRGLASLSASHPSEGGEVKAAIRGIWQQVLGSFPATDDTNFFLSGGDSFAGIMFINSLRCDLGMDITVPELMLHPTVSAIASFASSSIAAGAASDPLLFPIQTGGSHPPLFLVAGAHENRHYGEARGNSYEEDFFRYFGNMIANLGSDQPLYGFKPKGLAKGEHHYSTVGVMAAHFIESMRRIQPKGPYWIGGECVGGIVAYEMARQLEAAGEAVGALILLDTPRPSSYGSAREDIVYVRHSIMKFLRKTMKIMKSESRAGLARWIKDSFADALCVLFPFGRERRAMRRTLNGSVQYRRILYRYRPRGGFTGRVALLVNRKWNEKYFMQKWKRELGPRVSLYEIPGDHETRLVKSGRLVGSIIKTVIEGLGY